MGSGREVEAVDIVGRILRMVIIGSETQTLVASAAIDSMKEFDIELDFSQLYLGERYCNPTSG